MVLVFIYKNVINKHDQNKCFNNEFQPKLEKISLPRDYTFLEQKIEETAHKIYAKNYVIPDIPIILIVHIPEIILAM